MKSKVGIFPYPRSNRKLRPTESFFRPNPPPGSAIRARMFETSCRTTDNEPNEDKYAGTRPFSRWTCGYRQSADTGSKGRKSRRSCPRPRRSGCRSPDTGRRRKAGRCIMGTYMTQDIPPTWNRHLRSQWGRLSCFVFFMQKADRLEPRSPYIFMLLLCPGDNFASGSIYTLALLTAVGASPNPTAISFSLPG